MIRKRKSNTLIYIFYLIFIVIVFTKIEQGMTLNSKPEINYYKGIDAIFYGKGISFNKRYQAREKWDKNEIVDTEDYMSDIENIMRLMPEEYKDLKIDVIPYYFKGLSGYYKQGISYGKIVIARPYYGALDTFKHELGHHVASILMSDDKWIKYEELFEDDDVRYSDSTWDNMLSESFAEDFKIYIDYSIYKKDLKVLIDMKKTVYPFKEEMIDFFDKEFKFIRSLRD